jgi:hypothetical protein
LMAVLLEYGDKGMDLSNIKKKWNQVWGVPFPLEQTSLCTSSSASLSSPPPPPLNEQKNKKKVSLSKFLLDRAGDVIRLDRDQDNGTVKVYCKNCSRATVVQAAPASEMVTV